MEICVPISEILLYAYLCECAADYFMCVWRCWLVAAVYILLLVGNLSLNL